MSETTEKSQNITNLSVEQLNAIDLLVQGLADREVAEKVNVARETVTRWRNENAVFQAELNRKRQEIWGAAANKLKCLVTQAVDVLETELQSGNLKAAIEVLKAVGMHGNISEPSGATDPEIIQLNQAEAWARNELAKEPPDGGIIPDVFGEQEKLAQLVKHRLAELDRLRDRM